MERNCEKCIYHISGSCSKWDCEMTTLEDYRKSIIDECLSVMQAKDDVMIKASIKKVTKNDLIDAFVSGGLVSVYNLGLCNMYDYLIEKM